MTVTKAASRAAKELITVPVAGMTCTACERRIAKALTALPGVVSASASTRKGTASLIVTNESSHASIEAAIGPSPYGMEIVPTSRARSTSTRATPRFFSCSVRVASADAKQAILALRQDPKVSALLHQAAGPVLIVPEDSSPAERS